MIENIDDNVGLLFAKLHQWRLLDNTLVIFMSDNGMSGGVGRENEHLGERGDGSPMLAYNAGMKGLKGAADEGGVRVPFFVRWDDHLSPGRTVEVVAAHIDVLPTLAALAGADLPAGQVDGRSLLPLIAGEDADWPDRYLFTHLGRWPTGVEPDDFRLQNCAVRNQRFRLVNNQALFDMQQDPGQTTNVIEQHPQTVEAMRAAYDAWWRRVRPLMVNEEAPMSPTRPFHELYKRQLESTGIPAWEAPPI
jgi:arylsulfatase